MKNIYLKILFALLVLVDFTVIIVGNVTAALIAFLIGMAAFFYYIFRYGETD